MKSRIEKAKERMHNRWPDRDECDEVLGIIKNNLEQWGGF